MKVNANISMLVGRQGFMKAQAVMDRAMERLITGKRINRASDDPAGLIAADKLGARRVTLEELIKKSELLSHTLDAAEGALGEVQTLAQELAGLVVTAANKDGLSEGEREALQVEANGIVEGIKHLIRTSSFKGQPILVKGVGEDINGRWIGFSGLNADKLSIESLVNGKVSLVDGDMEEAQKLVEGFVEQMSNLRAHIGAQQKYLLKTDGLALELENTAAAESAIRDADFAEEISELVRGQVLREASMAVMQVAQQQAQSALSLLG
jgi:flagellin